MTRGRAAVLCAAILVFAWPDLARVTGRAPLFPLVTIVLALLLVALAVTWGRHGATADANRASRGTAWTVAVAGGAILAAAAYRWSALFAWLPYHADMLIVIREATKRFLSGHDPYTTYRSWDTGWDMAMPYGPALWGPYVVPQLLHFDLRTVTVVGELFAPAWCGILAVVEARRGRAIAAVAWLAVMAALVFALDVQRFTLIGHTPAYWPWFLLFAVAVAGERWVIAACLLAVLVAARQTMVAIVPVFLMAVWLRARGRTIASVVAFAAVSLAAFGPFAIWNVHALWEQTVASYPRIMKAAVWPVLARPGLETIGVTEWLLERGRGSLIAPVQVVALLAVYAAAWAALARGRRALAWMALALFAFSSTTLYPVHYLYYDVFLLLVCAGAAETLGSIRLGAFATAWAGSIAALGVVVWIAMRTIAPPFPHVAIGDSFSERMLRAGFSGIERDGARGFVWAVGGDARLAVPRSSSAPADIVIVADSPFERTQPPQRMTAILNGVVLGETAIGPDRVELRLAAPASAWWAGFNDLRLTFSATQSPHDAGGSDDRRPLALAISRVDIVPH